MTLDVTVAEQKVYGFEPVIPGMPVASLFRVRIVQIGGAVGQDGLKIYFFIGQSSGPAVRVGHSYGI